MSVRSIIFLSILAFSSSSFVFSMDTSNIDSTDSTTTTTSSGSHNDDGSVSGRP